ncbi:uncharacterized protein LOC129581600 [Paramacrobiotus metropolitanus]|uniref:uncharacterized protein LOC129581600 n=1 Tax=Paramacrobiotus metropolitanus TaxID=2943436 RepID=UPI0024456711|nr:uncharacterized protein LOC129581600 [Paramacrobiotus metropolitanus]
MVDVAANFAGCGRDCSERERVDSRVLEDCRRTRGECPLDVAGSVGCCLVEGSEVSEMRLRWRWDASNFLDAMVFNDFDGFADEFLGIFYTQDGSESLFTHAINRGDA